MESVTDDPSHMSEAERQATEAAARLVAAELSHTDNLDKRAEIVGQLGETLSKEGVIVVDVSQTVERRGVRTNRTRDQVISDNKRKKTTLLITRRYL